MWQSVALLAARLLIAALFVGGAVQKTQPQAVMELLAGKGMPTWLVWPAMAFNAGAGLALILGVWVTPVALALAAYSAFTSIFHFIPSDPWQMTIFVKNWAIAGGCLALAVAGPGKYALGA